MLEIQHEKFKMENKVLIIAEAGVNHNGNLDIAKKLIDEAVNAKVDIIKFQTFKASKLTTKAAQQAVYQERNTGKSEGQFEMLRNLELNLDNHLELIQYCEQKGIEFLSTPFDLDSIDLLKKIGIKVGKIPSGEITNLPYLRKMAENFPQIILSTGMSTMEDIQNALNVILNSGGNLENITILHCNTDYPTPFSDVNLNAMKTIANRFNTKIGYSDHTNGIEVPIAAVALGATLVEKHFTLDRNMEGPDHKASLEPNELAAMVNSIRNIEIALGSFEKKPSNSEIKNIEVARKSIVASCFIKMGELFNEKNITTKRPANGISPMKWDDVIGKKASKDFYEDDLILL